MSDDLKSVWSEIYGQRKTADELTAKAAGYDVDVWIDDNPATVGPSGLIGGA
tara:strand:+ start:137 stop:292 length:156 start_codon:yes stop_codon:yes gene_type:complete